MKESALHMSTQAHENAHGDAHNDTRARVREARQCRAPIAQKMTVFFTPYRMQVTQEQFFFGSSAARFRRSGCTNVMHRRA